MANFKLTEEGKNKLDKLPLIFRFVVKFILESLDSIINGECSEEQVANAIGSLKQNAQGKIGKGDTLNYDEAGKLLGFGDTNRVGLKKLLDKNNIKQIYINNMPCGFLRSEIMALHDRQLEEIRKRESKIKERTRNNKGYPN